MTPTLTKARRRALMKLRRFTASPFIASQAGLKGPTMITLQRCGWVERAEPPSNQPFIIASNGSYWRVTPTGCAAIEALTGEQE